MWEFICQHWDNNTNCVRGEGNTINLEAYVKISHVQLIKQCVLFEIDYAHYQSKCMLITNFRYQLFFVAININFHFELT